MNEDGLVLEALISGKRLKKSKQYLPCKMIPAYLQMGGTERNNLQTFA